MLIESQADGSETKKHKTSVEHSTTGAKHAIEKFDKKGRILAYLIAGHHIGMPDWPADVSGKAALCIRLKKLILST